jgi:hypothetical protein
MRNSYYNKTSLHYSSLFQKTTAKIDMKDSVKQHFSDIDSSKEETENRILASTEENIRADVDVWKFYTVCSLP